MAAPILWAPRISVFFLQEKNLHVHKIPRFRGGGGILGWRGKCRFYFYGRGDVSELRKRVLTEFCGKLGGLCKKLGEFRFGTQIVGWEELTEFSPQNLVRAKQLTELGVWNRALRNRIRPVSESCNPWASSLGIFWRFRDNVESKWFIQQFCSASLCSLGCPRSTVEKGPQSNESYERENPWNRAISTVLWMHRKLPQSTVKKVLPSNESYESKTGCSRTLAAWIPLLPWFCSKFQGFGGRENSGKFRGIQWNSVELCMALSIDSVGDFGATPDFRENLGFGVVSGDLGGQKAFAQITRLHLIPDLAEVTLISMPGLVPPISCLRTCCLSIAIHKA